MQIQRGEKRTDPETKDFAYWYHVHYIGWSKNHDSWLEEKDLIKYDVDLLTGGTSAAADEARRKAKEAAEAKRQKQLLSEIPAQLRLRIPWRLKSIVLDDYERVMQQGKCLPLPRPNHCRPSVATIVTEWKDARITEAEETDREDAEEIKEQAEIVAEGLISYFNNALRQLLLYQPEVQVTGEALDGGASPADVCGAEHLVRLFVKLPELVSVAMMTQGDASKVVALENNLHDLMAMMADIKTQGRLFSSADEYQQNPHWTPPPLLAATQGLPRMPSLVPQAGGAQGTSTPVEAAANTAGGDDAGNGDVKAEPEQPEPMEKD